MTETERRACYFIYGPIKNSRVGAPHRYCLQGFRRRNDGGGCVQWPPGDVLPGTETRYWPSNGEYRSGDATRSKRSKNENGANGFRGAPGARVAGTRSAKPTGRGEEKNHPSATTKYARSNSKSVFAKKSVNASRIRSENVANEFRVTPCSRGKLKRRSWPKQGVEGWVARTTSY